ncbi:PREDICTED: ankyrin repeat domain-containing protein 13C-like [Priapulus caudatus]|uniref:Ankyrin repeat domain-containing protein 13C-like n=1 Tax=Priapulus caudatus TaxID=37621 RepID=A0ABM1F3V3_PRICU|nr:PREDICTED: ankyrin repeat domain-containing protein 13C-like [Priapulus caudatus]
MLGRKECVHLLLAHNAPVKIKNSQGWSPLAEAISYGDRQTITSLLRKLKQQSREALEERRPKLTDALKQLGDFYMELKWDFQSWVPLVSRILPSDICRIHKRGSSIRMDTTLLDFNDMRWERGDISFIFDGDAKPSHSLTVLDNRVNSYQKIRYEESEVEIEEEVDILMSSDIVAAQMSTKSITFSRSQSGWFFRENRTELVGPFSADFYAINGMNLASRKRREHLSEEDLQKNKAVIENLSKGNTAVIDTTLETNVQQHKRNSLPPPPQAEVTWEHYISTVPAPHPHLGRQLVYKESLKGFRATVAMSKEFPLSIEVLLDVLEVIAPFKHFSKLRDFVQMKLPPGFPVKIDIPVLPTISARVTFQEFHFRDDIPASLFQIPRDYQEDCGRFPEL